tara:strand:- start:5260 stop:5736 length:477 start_codon:yes stop_codon:yes gene_type:complete
MKRNSINEIIVHRATCGGETSGVVLSTVVDSKFRTLDHLISALVMYVHQKHTTVKDSDIIRHQAPVPPPVSSYDKIHFTDMSTIELPLISIVLTEVEHGEDSHIVTLYKLIKDLYDDLYPGLATEVDEPAKPGTPEPAECHCTTATVCVACRNICPSQ